MYTYKRVTLYIVQRVMHFSAFIILVDRMYMFHGTAHPILISSNLFLCSNQGVPAMKKVALDQERTIRVQDTIESGVSCISRDGRS